ncbi:MAG: replication-associated recombination protein A [Gammaproteobacteria bacterium]|nr:MAG: replication-associated recombination protein A [Gammaproteobacteria bacterium]
MTDGAEGHAPTAPLAARLRPADLAGMAGQQHLLGPGRPLAGMIERGRVHSMILWGPPGTGKTTLAGILAAASRQRLVALSAVMAGVKDVRAAVEQARRDRESDIGTILFIDEVHRFNKAQQDAFLPFVEDGTLTFIGATTENPSFEVRSALLSRARVYRLRLLTESDLQAVLERGRERLEAEGVLLEIAPDATPRLLGAADGDARRLLNLLELAADLAPLQEGRRRIDAEVLAEVTAGDLRRFDKGGDAFYDQISALHKAVRGSSPDAALYWLLRMLDGGADPLYVARRVVRMASEDIGNADPRGLAVALDAWHVQERLGSPEGELALAQAVIYLACAPKSNAVYAAYNAMLETIRSGGSLEVPVHLRNAPTRLLKEIGHGAEYRYAHNWPDAYVPGESYVPRELASRRFYQPVDRGLEQRLAQKLAWMREQDAASAWQRWDNDGRDNED